MFLRKDEAKETGTHLFRTVGPLHCRLRGNERRVQNMVINLKRGLSNIVALDSTSAPRRAIRLWRPGRAAAVIFLILFFLAIASQAWPQDPRVAGAIKKIDDVVARGPFHASWDSLEKYEVPEWYRDAKFGIFIHWGVYSVPAFDSEWYPRNMYIVGSPVFKHHVATYGPQSKFGYKDFIPMFKAEKFNAGEWAELFRKSGAKYVVPVAEHHDGFPLYDYDFTDWSAAKIGPKRDVVGELAEAVRNKGLHFGASSHRAEHWWFYNGGMAFDSDVQDPRYAAFYGPAQSDKTQPDQAFLDDWLVRTSQIVDKYHPQVVWFDWWIEQPVFQPYLKKFAAYYYNRGAEWKQGVAINYKHKSFPEHAAVLDIERGKLETIRPFFWQTDTSVGEKSWGYIQNEKFRNADSLVDELVDIVSKNGCLLLNIGPRSDGTIPTEVQSLLLDIGAWLNVNGEAIYGTRPWKISGEGPTKVIGGAFKDTAGTPFTGEDIRFTAKGDTLFAVALAWPGNGKLTIKSLASGGALTKSKIQAVQLLGYTGKLHWVQNRNGLVVDLPAQKPGDYAFAFKIAPVDAAP
jgi:alpha-L-fucosidase